jgi:hypothetical protein
MLLLTNKALLLNINKIETAKHYKTSLVIVILTIGGFI